MSATGAQRRTATGPTAAGYSRRRRWPSGYNWRWLPERCWCWLFWWRLAYISIHAPREGCDGNAGRRPGFACLYFNPRTPRGVRLGLAVADQVAQQFQSTHPARGATANFTKEQRVCLAQFAYLHKGKKAEHTKTNAPMLHEAFLYAFWVRTGRRRRVLLDFARYKIKGSSGR